MKTKLHVITFLVLFESCSLITGYGLGARFVEFWRYVFTKDEELNRQKRITVDEDTETTSPIPSTYDNEHEYGNTRHPRQQILDEPHNIVGWIQESKPIFSPSQAKAYNDKENVLSERSAELENPTIVGRGTHTIRTLSITQVPVDESSGEDDKSFSEAKSQSGESSSGSVHVPGKEGRRSYTDIIWPKGTYGLPKPEAGCPDLDNFLWKTGFRFHDTEDDGTENQHSDVFHLAGNFTDDGIRHDFCVKDNPNGQSEWPEGKYCIYKRGPLCPRNLKEGFVIWDDENTDNQNDKGGALPDGQYTEDTKIYFCCYTTGDADVEIYLPNLKPFYLFAYQSIKCQRVSGMRVTSEFVKFDDEDRGNIDYEGGEYPYGIHKAQKDHMLFLCYYEPYPAVVAAARNHDVKSTQPKPSPQVSTEATIKQKIPDEKDEEQESLEKSEEMMRAFMKAAGGEDDETNKSERTRTIIKTIRVPGKTKSYTTAIVIGLVLSGVVVSTAIILIAKYVISRNNVKQLKAERVETTWMQRSTEGEVEDARSEDEMSIIETDFDEFDEEDELVEDQLLPDSELKSGLELMFLKQQRHYWRQKHSDRFR